jgi:ABC-type transport system involved in multi-copper enzyme maturation permease subunit
MQALRNIWFLALATCTEGIRHKALWAIVGLAILLTMANVGVTTLYNWDLGKVSVEFGLSAVAFAGLLLVFFLGLKILADDLERSRIFMLLSRPVSIWEYLTGKFLGLGLILLLTTIILGVSAALSMRFVLWQYPGYIPPIFPGSPTPWPLPANGSA